MSASRTTKPLSAHPAFPVIVALWFAALLGLGTFVVPPANFEGLVVGTGLDELLPAAAPPLGDTARLAISAIAALLGALLGLGIAARIRRVQDGSQALSEAAEPATDSPWLADDDEAVEQDFSGKASTDEPGLDDLAESEAPGIVPTRLAGRHSMSDRDDPLPGDETEDTEEEAERIFQASEIDLSEAAEADTVAPDEAETPSRDEDDDLQRFAADRLVAGLPRVQRRNFDDEPLEDWSRPEPVAEERDLEAGFAATPEPSATEPQEVETEGPNFDTPELVEEAEYEEAEYEELPVEPAEAQEWAPAASDTPTEPSWAADVEREAEPEPAPLDFAASSLSDLVARFDAALAAQRLQPRSDHADPAEEQPEPASVERSDDPVIAFLRREADRDRGAPGEPQHERPDDPRAGLRNALDKLDKVSRKS